MALPKTTRIPFAEPTSDNAIASTIARREREGHHSFMYTGAQWITIRNVVVAKEHPAIIERAMASTGETRSRTVSLRRPP
eukprot:6292905-Pyramimonas_sp.AAC.1